jgi:hypothetical protein
MVQLTTKVGRSGEPVKRPDMVRRRDSIARPASGSQEQATMSTADRNATPKAPPAATLSLAYTSPDRQPLNRPPR